MASTTNNDTGSLKVGAAGAGLKVGDKIQVAGEKAARTITYLMGTGDRLHVCARGTGPFPTGEVSWEQVTD